MTTIQDSGLDLFILVFLFVLPPGISSLDFKRSSGFRDTARKKSPVLEIFHSAVKTLLFNIFGCGFQHFSDPYSYFRNFQEIHVRFVPKINDFFGCSGSPMVIVRWWECFFVILRTQVFCDAIFSIFKSHNQTFILNFRINLICGDLLKVIAIL